MVKKENRKKSIVGTLKLNSKNPKKKEQLRFKKHDVESFFKKLSEFLVRVKLIVLLCHHNADPDAVCAAFAFSRLLKRLRPEIGVEIAAAQGLSRLSKFLLNYLPVEMTMRPNIKDAELIVLLDTNTLQQLDGWSELVKSSDSPIVVIDHHALHPETASLAGTCMVDDEASSTCQIVFRLFEEAKIKPNEEEAKALFLGSAFDTKHFILADPETFKMVAKLVDAGIDTKECLSLLSLPMEYSERVARLKACQRTKIIKIDEWLIALSRIGSYQASAARALVASGAHASVVVGRSGETIQASMRSQSDFFKKTGVHLGRDVAKPLGEFLRGMGGGHSTAAGANGTGNIDASLKYCKKLFKEKMAT